MIDIVGDVHGCIDELHELLIKLNVLNASDLSYNQNYNRELVFVGDLVDRGPSSFEVLKLVRSLMKYGVKFVRGNHDDKLLRYYLGKKIVITDEIQRTIDQLKDFDSDLISLLSAPLFLVYGKLVICHAGMPLRNIHKHPYDRKVLSQCLYGEVNGMKDSEGRNIRLTNWTKDYSKYCCVYGHTVVENVLKLENTYCIDTGCVFGGTLTCLRYPELEIVSIKAKKTYYEK